MTYKKSSKIIFATIALSWLVQLVNKYLWSDWEFVTWLAILIAIDTATGMWYAFRMGVINSNAMQSTIRKVVLYGITLVLIHVITNVTVRGNPNIILSYIMPQLDAIMYSYIVLREVVSIVENVGKLGYNVFPKWIMRKINDFNEEGKYEK